jgi:hypothetical protein
MFDGYPKTFSVNGQGCYNRFNSQIYDILSLGLTRRLHEKRPFHPLFTLDGPTNVKVPLSSPSENENLHNLNGASKGGDLRSLVKCMALGLRFCPRLLFMLNGAGEYWKFFQ